MDIPTSFVLIIVFSMAVVRNFEVMFRQMLKYSVQNSLTLCSVIYLNAVYFFYCWT
jgi:hypothetical protein